MKPSAFVYHAPTTLEGAVAVLGAHGDEAKVLAGGQSLVPMLALRLARFEHLVDINSVVGLDDLAVTDDAVSIGATVRQSFVEKDAGVAAAIPLLPRAVRHVGHAAIRNRGTVCGSIAHADPASELPAVALALDAQLLVQGPQGARRVDAAEFFQGTWQTALADGELVSGVRFSRWPQHSGFAVAEIARRSGDFALAGVVGAVTVADGVVAKVAVAMFGVAATPVRATAVEQALAGAAVESLDLAEIAQLARQDCQALDDVHGSAAYRTTMSAVLVRRVLTAAIEEASGV